jgi:hypothetical protein
MLVNSLFHDRPNIRVGIEKGYRLGGWVRFPMEERDSFLLHSVQIRDQFIIQ